MKRNAFKHGYLLVPILLMCPGLVWALELTGDFVQGGLLRGKVAPGTAVTVHGQRLRLGAGGEFIIGLDRDEPAELVVTTGTGTAAQQHRFKVDKRKYNIQYVDGIAKKIMEPDPADVARARREAELVKEARATDRDAMDFAAGFRWPLLGPITGVFGSQRVYNGEPSRPHYGVDVAAPVGTVVRAPAPGLVTLAYPDMFYSGGTLIIDHGQSLSSSFLHLSKILVQQGDYVEAGDPIAEVGATGRVTGPHLDWRMNWYDAKIDPQLLVPEMAAGGSNEE